jgi:hypothetical protein
VNIDKARLLKLDFLKDGVYCVLYWEFGVINTNHTDQSSGEIQSAATMEAANQN